MGEAAAIHAVRFARLDARGRFFQKWRMTSRRTTLRLDFLISILHPSHAHL